MKPIPKNDDTDPLLPLCRRPPHVQINWVDPPDGLAVEQKACWLQPLLSEDGAGFTLNDLNMQSRSFFDFDGARSAVFNLAKGRETRDGLDGSSIRYFAYELPRSFTPEKTGTYSLGPAIVKGTFVAGFDGNEYTARRLVVIAPAVPIDVGEVPQPRPATFCGGIGEYQLTASASPTNLRVGDPLTLTLEIERSKQSGSLELISAPDLSANPQLAADFDLLDKNPTGRFEGAVKKFSPTLCDPNEPTSASPRSRSRRSIRSPRDLPRWPRSRSRWRFRKPLASPAATWSDRYQPLRPTTSRHEHKASFRTSPTLPNCATNASTSSLRARRSRVCGASRDASSPR